MDTAFIGLPPAIAKYDNQIFFSLKELSKNVDLKSLTHYPAPVKFSTKRRELYLSDEIEIITNVKSFDVKTCKVTEKFINEDELFKYDLKDNFELFLSFLQKTRAATESIVEKPGFKPTLTGGLDTRVLLHFWRDYLDEIDEYFLKPFKTDGKNNVERGSIEVEISKKIVSTLGKELTHSAKTSRSLSGQFTENGRSINLLNNKEWILLYPSITLSDAVSIGWNAPEERFIRPFLFKEYLMLRHPEVDFMRTLLYMLFVKPRPELASIEFAGFSNRPLYKYDEAFAKKIEKVQELLDYWGPEKVKILRSC